MTRPFDGIVAHPHLRLAEEARPGEPFVHRIRVGWGDCDPARIAYTARIPAWALESLEAWWEHRVGMNWYAMALERNLCTPFVHMKMDFRSPVTPRHPLDCEVVVARLGHRSLAHRVRGRQDGVLCFEGEFVVVFVDASSMKPHTPPADIVERIRSSMLTSGDRGF